MSTESREAADKIERVRIENENLWDAGHKKGREDERASSAGGSPSEWETKMCECGARWKIKGKAVPPRTLDAGASAGGEVEEALVEEALGNIERKIVAYGVARSPAEVQATFDAAINAIRAALRARQEQSEEVDGYREATIMLASFLAVVDKAWCMIVGMLDASAEEIRDAVTMHTPTIQGWANKRRLETVGALPYDREAAQEAIIRLARAYQGGGS